MWHHCGMSTIPWERPAAPPVECHLQLEVAWSYDEGMALPHQPGRDARGEPDLVELAARAAQDPSARTFVDEVKAALADGSIHDQLATQANLQRIIQEHSR